MEKLRAKFTIALCLVFAGLFSAPAFAAKESCAAELAELNGNIVSANTLRLKAGDGSRIDLPGHNYYEHSDEFSEVIAYVLSRSPKDQAEFNKQLKEELAKREMSFSLKNKKTGNYDQIFKVHVNGMPLYIPQQYFDDLIKSIAPIMKAMRSLSQKIFSEKNLTAKSLGIESMPKREQEIVIGIIRESIYYERALIHPNMKDYPFFSVVGFDAALGRLDKVLGKFFEYNSGTPSGLSNNIQLLEILRKTQPELFEKMRPYLRLDKTFAELRRVTESNALKWTENDEGISVVIGPGVYNGAHPDVASIAHFSNMPLVKASDLYQDASGKIRLNTGKNEKDPVVSGIYNRTEESFLVQDSEKGIAWKVPDYEDNPELGKKWDVDLEAGVAYQFKYDSKGERIGVFTDNNGKPLLAESWDKIGVDPSRPDAPPGSFVDALVNRNLFITNIGGRVVDDKRLFEYMAKYQAQQFAEAGQVIAGPPRTLRAADLAKLSPQRRKIVEEAQEKWIRELEIWKKKFASFESGDGPDPGIAPKLDVPELQADEYNEFFKNPELYVVKAPDGSGGAGIDIMPILSEAERAEVVEKVRKDVASGKYRLSIQEFAEPGLLPSVEKNGSGEWQFGSLANDLRTFGFMDGDDNVSAGSQAFLLRVANLFSGSTNNSQGAGYGIGVVMDPSLKRGEELPKGQSVLPLPKATDPKKPLPASRFGEINRFTSDLQMVLDRVALRQATQLRKDDLVDRLIVGHRSLIDVIGTEHSHFITTMRDFQEGKIKAKEFYTQMAELKRTVQNKSTSYEGAADHFKAGFTLAETLNKSHKGPTIGEPASLETVRKLVSRRKLSKPVKVRTETSAGSLLDIYEVGVVTSSKEKFVQDIVNEVTSVGGEVRLLKQKFRHQRKWLDDSSSGLFRVDGNGKPIIGIDFTQTHSLAALAHEFEHYKMWKELTDQEMQNGLSQRAASLKAYKLLNLPDNRFMGERASLRAERKIEATIISELNKGPTLPPQRASDYGYIRRDAYPLVTKIRENLYRLSRGIVENKEHTGRFPSENDVEAEYAMKALIREGEGNRKLALQQIDEELNKNIADSTRDALLRKKQHFEQSILLPLLMNQYETGQFMALGIWDDFMKLYNDVLAQRNAAMNRQIQSVPSKPKKNWGPWRNTSLSRPLR